MDCSVSPLLFVHVCAVLVCVCFFSLQRRPLSRTRTLCVPLSSLSLVSVVFVAGDDDFVGSVLGAIFQPPERDETRRDEGDVLEARARCLGNAARPSVERGEPVEAVGASGCDSCESARRDMSTWYGVRGGVRGKRAAGLVRVWEGGRRALWRTAPAHGKPDQKQAGGPAAGAV